MNTFARSLYSLVAMVLVVSCGGTGTNRDPNDGELCDLPADFASSSFDFVLDYEFSNNSRSGYAEIVTAGAEVRMGADAAGQPGNSRGTAVSTFDCSTDGSKCYIEISTGTRPAGGTFEPGEKLKVKLSWAEGGTSKEWVKEFDHAFTYPRKITVGTCSDITVELGMTDGDTPGVQSKTATTVRRKCTNC